MNIYEKLQVIQARLKAPKDQYNSFGKYKYRNVESIYEAVKPLLSEVKATLTVSDVIEESCCDDDWRNLIWLHYTS